jgi:hypothetical protein
MSLLEEIGVAAFAVALTAVAGVIITYLFTERRAKAASRRERGEAAAAEFYRAYGTFFAVWKSWDDLGARRASKDGAEQLEFLRRVADAEGLLESFLVRLTLEHELSKPDLDRLWCFRRGYKQLRYSIRDRRRLGWRRTDRRDPAGHEEHLAYRAFKGLAVTTATLLLDERSAAAKAPTTATARERLAYVTGSSRPLRRCFRGVLAARSAERKRQGLDDSSGWEWIAIAEHLVPTRPSS